MLTNSSPQFKKKIDYTEIHLSLLSYILLVNHFIEKYLLITHYALSTFPVLGI